MLFLTSIRCDRRELSLLWKYNIAQSFTEQLLNSPDPKDGPVAPSSGRAADLHLSDGGVVVFAWGHHDHKSKYRDVDAEQVFLPSRWLY